MAEPTVEWWAQTWAGLKVVSLAPLMAAQTAERKVGPLEHWWAAKMVAKMAEPKAALRGMRLAVTSAAW